MIVPKLTLLSHLERISCDGEIEEVVLTGKFQATAVHTDRQMMVHTLGMAEIEPLTSPVGVMDLNLLLQVIRKVGDDEGKVSIEFVENRIVVEERGRAKVMMVTANPDTIGTTAKPENTNQLLEKVNKEGKSAPLTQLAVKDVMQIAQLLKVETITAHIAPTQVTWVLGQSTGHNAEVVMAVAGGRGKKKTLTEEPYDLTFNTRHLISILKQVVDYTQTVFVVTGPGSMAAIADTQNTYLISPVRQSN